MYKSSMCTNLSFCFRCSRKHRRGVHSQMCALHRNFRPCIFVTRPHASSSPWHASQVSMSKVWWHLSSEITSRQALGFAFSYITGEEQSIFLPVALRGHVFALMLHLCCGPFYSYVIWKLLSLAITQWFKKKKCFFCALTRFAKCATKCLLTCTGCSDTWSLMMRVQTYGNSSVQNVGRPSNSSITSRNTSVFIQARNHLSAPTVERGSRTQVHTHHIWTPRSAGC